MKNVARTYSLEHEGESFLFDQLFTLLDPNMHNEESCRRELASCTGALETSISQHMSKEEEQVCIYVVLLAFVCFTYDKVASSSLRYYRHLGYMEMEICGSVTKSW